jgi:hypothetical protein
MTRKIIPLPPQNVLHALLDYSPTTGVFTWRKSNGTAAAGREAGWLHKAGYVYIGLGGRNYKAHRLAWMYVYGVDPAGLLDHRDRDKTNNRIANLREVTDGQNNQNKQVYRNNASGHKGIGWYARRNAWRVRIQHEGAVHLIGFFKDIPSAIAARKAAEQALHTHATIF